MTELPPATGISEPSAGPFPLGGESSGVVHFDKIEPAMLRVVVPVVYVTGDGTFIGCGTAFAVAGIDESTAIFATAAHVLRDFASNHPKETPSLKFKNVMFEQARREDLAGNFYVILPSSTESAKAASSMSFVSITQISIAAGEKDYGWMPRDPHRSDVALLVASLDGSCELPALSPISFVRPREGSRCNALGFSTIQPGAAISTTELSFGFTFSRSAGEILSVHPSGEAGGAVADFPLFKTDTAYASGMSGGPVLDDQGQVVGIVSNSPTHGGGPSRCALNGGLLELVLQLPIEGGTDGIKFGQLFDRPFFNRAGSTCEFTRDPTGVRVNWPDAAPSSST